MNRHGGQERCKSARHYLCDLIPESVVRQPYSTLIRHARWISLAIVGLLFAHGVCCAFVVRST